MNSPASYPVKFILQRFVRYLANKSGQAIQRAICATGGALQLGDGHYLPCKVRRFEVRDMPPDSCLPVESVEFWEEGMFWCDVEEIVWEDGTTERGVRLHEQELWGGGVVAKVRLEPARIESDTPAE